MATEIIDLTGSPPPPSRSSETQNILNFAATSTEQMQFEKVAMPLCPCPNPNFSCTNQQQATMLLASGHTYEPSQGAPRFQPSMHGGQVTTVLEQVPESNVFLVPSGSRLNEHWTQREHELFLMGLIKYGRGCWTKIAKHFLCNKTPQQVQSYATSFFRNLPDTNFYNFGRKNPTYSTANVMTRNRNFMCASTPYLMPTVAMEPQATLKLFPEKSPFFPAPSYGEASSSTASTTMYGLQMKTSLASTSVTTSCTGEVDLELRLGWYQ